MRSIFLLAAALFAASLASGQVQQAALAAEYAKQGDYDKAVVLYETLWEDSPEDINLYKAYYQCLLALQRYDELDKILRKQIKRYPESLTFLVDKGYLESQRGNESASREAFEEALDKLPPMRRQIVQLANLFSAINAYDFAIQAYEVGSKRLGGQESFSYELANLYYTKGDIPSMIEAYLDFLAEDPRRMTSVEANLQRNLDEPSEYESLQASLYTRIQKTPNDPRWPELLIWTFVQQGDYTAAFQQVQALDRRFNESGQRVFDFARTAQAEEEWDAAILAYDYIVRKGQDNAYYFNARMARVDCRRQKLLLGLDYTEEDLLTLQGEYKAFLREYPRRDGRAAETLRQLADLEARYLHRLDTAAVLLEEALTWRGLPAGSQAAIKLDLGDCYLMQGDIWESTLLYSQVDKTMKDEPLGEMARFRNARLSYFNADFDWAQAQLEVLKASTSELVANDALDLAVFISENLALDSTSDAMQYFSRAELLTYQYRIAEADVVLDSLTKAFPGHMLSDDVLWLRAELAQWDQDFPLAVTYLESLRELYGYDILGDDALFTLGVLYEEKLGDTEKAMACFQELMLDHADSVFVVEARKRFRALRGDTLN